MTRTALLTSKCFDKICRTCLSDIKGECFISVFKTYLGDKIIKDVLQLCASIQVGKRLLTLNKTFFNL